MIATVALLVAASLVSPDAAPSQRSGYPKVFRCQSAIQTPVARPAFNQACLHYREAELARVMAMPVDARIARVKTLRTLIGLQPGEGLDITSSGMIRPARIETSSIAD